MFLENTVNQKEQFGWIEVICGSMFSGKTEELIRRLRRAQFARQRVEIFKPAIDVRYHDDRVVSHDQNEIRSTPVPAAANIPILADNCDVVGIDEAQFFDDEIVKVCNDLANRVGRRAARPRARPEDWSGPNASLPRHRGRARAASAAAQGRRAFRPLSRAARPG